LDGKPAGEPPNLGKGWIGYDFKRHFKKPLKLINDAAMQALGSYQGGRMLFVGLGSGFGSALILDRVIIPLELGELADSKGRRLADVLGKQGLSKRSVHHWKQSLHNIIPHLKAAFLTDDLVIGGGNVKLLPKLPKGTRRGSNDFAFIGG